MSSPQTPVRSLLLVDDDEALLQVLGRALQRRGYEVHPASTLAQARERIAAHCPDGALIDLKLERESGLDLITDLKAVNEDMVIVVLTGYASIATAVAAIKRGASNYLAKPASVDDVVRALQGREDLPPAEDYAPMSVDRLEWEHIQKVLRENDGNISATARSLGMYRRTLQRKLAKKPVSR
jgi:two-component system response regulator RegA